MTRSWTYIIETGFSHGRLGYRSIVEETRDESCANVGAKEDDISNVPFESRTVDASIGVEWSIGHLRCRKHGISSVSKSISYLQNRPSSFLTVFTQLSSKSSINA